MAQVSTTGLCPLHVEVLRLFRRPTHTPSRSWACAVCQPHNKVSRHYGKWTKWQASYTRRCPCTATSGYKGPAHFGDVCQTRGMAQHVQVTCQLHTLCPGTVTPRMPATRQSVQALREQKHINLKGIMMMMQNVVVSGLKGPSAVPLTLTTAFSVRNELVHNWSHLTCSLVKPDFNFWKVLEPNKQLPNESRPTDRGFSRKTGERFVI